MDRSMTMLMIVGALLTLLGVAGLAIPEFTTRQTTNVATIGDLNIQAREETSHIVPPVVAGSAVVLGIFLVGGGLFRRRRTS
jgi:hypothetical protein